MYRVVLTILAISLFLVFPQHIFAEGNSFITIVNPQRISTYTKDYLGSFREEWSQIEKRDFAATWPVTYDVLLKKDFVSDLKKLNDKQEFGIFLEVTPNLAKAAEVSYNQTSSWHYATSLFLTGYKQNDRKKLIDTVFKKFKETFGYYPVSVAAWWVDSYSLSYMKEKYGITGVLGVSDQYDLDNYQVWGTWWSVPYYPNKTNAAVPAQSKKDKLDVLTFRWASRDPLNGYKSPTKNAASLYSLQDYATLHLPISYFQTLLETYAIQSNENQFGQATVGLEGDLPISNYQNQFAEQLEVVKNLETDGKIQVVTMKDFSSWYKTSFPDLSPAHIIAATDPLGKSEQIAIWKQTPFYRVGVTYNPTTTKTHIIDLRTYLNNFEEPFYGEPNKQLNLSINLPFTIDTAIMPSSGIELGLGALKNIASAGLTFEKGTIGFQAKKTLLPGKTLDLSQTFSVTIKGALYKDSSLTIPFTLKRRIPLLPSAIPFFIPKTFYISQAEIDALSVLKRLPSGKTLVFDKDCLKCAFTGQYKPAAAAGKKSYIKTYSNKPVQLDISFLLARTSQEAKNILKKNNIRYVYLTHYEDFIETLPYLPQDLGATRVYQNANATIWEITSR